MGQSVITAVTTGHGTMQKTAPATSTTSVVIASKTTTSETTKLIHNATLDQ